MRLQERKVKGQNKIIKREEEMKRDGRKGKSKKEKKV
jgi:hypothetical protein